MAINAVITGPRPIVANTSQLVSSQSQPPIDLKNNGAALSQQYLSHLLDVSIGIPVGGEVLTYNANTGKYDLELVSFPSGAIDGGTF